MNLIRVPFTPYWIHGKQKEIASMDVSVHNHNNEEMIDNKMVECTHPDHVDGKSCEDHAVGCHKDCRCCFPMPPDYEKEMNMFHDCMG
jgi:hypothetical protein